MVERALKWLLPALVVAEILLVWANLLSLHDAVLFVVGIEALLLLVGVRQLFAATRCYRGGYVSVLGRAGSPARSSGSETSRMGDAGARAQVYILRKDP
jgi:hypothetical protein